MTDLPAVGTLIDADPAQQAVAFDESTLLSVQRAVR